MSFHVVPLHPLFGAEVQGIQCASLNDDTFDVVRAIFERYSVVVFRDQRMTDDDQINFSRRFGELEVTAKANPGSGSYFAHQSNTDGTSDGSISQDDRRMLHQKANQLWHTDSSYRCIPALASLLLARELPSEGGNTEFVSTRVAYDAMPESETHGLLGLVAEHSLAHSRSLVDSRALTDEMRNERPPAHHPLIRVNLKNGQRSIFAGAHASHIVGWQSDDGRSLIQELNEFMAQPKFVYSHQWKPNDLVLWDNRCTLHRATPFDIKNQRRKLQRTTVAGDEFEYQEELKRISLF